MTSLNEEMAMSEGANTQTDEGYGSRTVVVTNRDGLHARPCSVIVTAVGRYRANVTDTEDEASDGNRVAKFVIEKLFLKQLEGKAGVWPLD